VATFWPVQVHVATLLMVASTVLGPQTARQVFWNSL